MKWKNVKHELPEEGKEVIGIVHYVDGVKRSNRYEMVTIPKKGRCFQHPKRTI
jgi:hypothetical protein